MAYLRILSFNLFLRHLFWRQHIDRFILSCVCNNMFATFVMVMFPGYVSFCNMLSVLHSVLLESFRKLEKQTSSLLCLSLGRGGGVLPKILGGVVPHGSQNPDPISDQNIRFFILLFRPDPESVSRDWLPFAQCTT